jgi:hypothetical protein
MFEKMMLPEESSNPIFFAPFAAFLSDLSG